MKYCNLLHLSESREARLWYNCCHNEAGRQYTNGVVVMTLKTFSDAAKETLQHYVYRLVDPRNGETFYVGRGQGDRVFQHVAELIKSAGRDEPDPKFSRIIQIHGEGLEVQHIIHRHGMCLDTAKEVEAALIDAYPGLTNRMGGAGSNDRGVRHADQIIREHDAPEFELKHKLILISIGKTYEERGVYEAVRGFWQMNRSNARAHDLVLARVGRFVVGAYKVEEWVDWAPGVFPYDPEGLNGRIGFVGTCADKDIWNHYVNKRVPDNLLSKGAANPFRYLQPSCEGGESAE